jgi:DNA (cytosine-5)-methyltransferase 1
LRSLGDFRFVDLFSGIGGMRLGLEAVGGRCVYSVELDQFARRTYAANFGHAPEGGDIRDVRALPEHDVLAAGFPCQPFSLAGISKKRSLGRDDGFLDKAQGTLFFEVLRLASETKPRVVFLENVKHLLRHDSGRTYEVIKGSLNEIGYTVSESVIDARSWVPQHRERIFIVGLRREHYGTLKFVFPQLPRSSVTLASILDSDVDPKYRLTRHLWRYLREYADRHRARGNGFGFGLVGPTDVARTLSARYHKDGSEILIRGGRGRTPRRLTPRECCRLMGFPKEFRIVVSDTQAYRQFGNAVVPHVVRHVARALVTQADLHNVTEQLPLAM